MKTRTYTSILLLFISVLGALAQANGKLQLHFLDVGNGDCAVLISPQGEVVFFDAGYNNCDKPVSYLRRIGITRIDYLIVSHYHLDHIGCAARFLNEFPLQKEAIDRGSSYNNGAFQPYVDFAGTKRNTGTAGRIITLDSGSANPVTINIVALNGAGVATDDENDRSLVAKVSFGEFDAEIGGDLSGFNESRYKDIETTVAPMVGQVELYKVHHHGSSHSSNPEWLRITQPKVGIVSCGSPNRHGHPTQETMDALHQANVKTYWTSAGDGAAADPSMDFVGSNIVVESAPGSQTFTVSRAGMDTHTYTVWGAPAIAGGSGSDTAPQHYWWSNQSASRVYHYSQCNFVNPNSANWSHSGTPPAGWRLHAGCPR
jgi:beta-lactamase superfamily II metal-dependent hydrolase